MEQWFSDHRSIYGPLDVENPDPTTELIAKISGLNSSSTSMDDWAETAKAIAQNHPRASSPKLMFDVSELVQRDSRSGIQRVVRAVLAHFLATPPAGWQIALVHSIPGTSGLKTASNFTRRFLGLPAKDEEDYIIEPQNGDILLGLDLNHGNVINHEGYLRSPAEFGRAHLLCDL